MRTRNSPVRSQQVGDDDRINLDVVAFTIVTTASVVMLIYYIGNI